MAARIAPLFVFCALLAASAPTARAEPTGAEHALGFGLGYARYVVLDEAATSLAYRANLVTGALGYAGEAGRMRWALRLGTAFGHQEAAGQPGREVRFVDDDLDGTQEVIRVPMRGPLHLPSGELALERRVDLGRASLFFGGAARYELRYANGFVRPGLLQLVSLRPSVAVRWRWHPRQALELGARTTVVAWGTRMPYDQTASAPNATPYEGLVRKGSAVRSVNVLQTLELEASYELRFGAHGAARAALGLDYLHDTDPRPLFALRSRADLTILYRF